jgi:hypothetical protein
MEIFLEGEISLELDDGKMLALKAGDVVVEVGPRIAKIARKGLWPAERNANEWIGLFKKVNHATDQSRPKCR